MKGLCFGCERRLIEQPKQSSAPSAFPPLQWEIIINVPIKDRNEHHHLGSLHRNFELAQPCDMVSAYVFFFPCLFFQALTETIEFDFFYSLWSW